MVPAKAQVQYVEGHKMVGVADSNHLVAIDTSVAGGGQGSANDPVQLLMIALAGCSAIDIVDIIRKSRKQLVSLKVEVEGRRYPDPPKILRSLSYHVSLEGEEISPDLVARAITLSLTKYCSVALSLDRSVHTTARFTLNGQSSAAWEVSRDPSIFERPEK